MSKKTAADFKIGKTLSVGSLKPDPIASRKTYESAVGIVPAGTSSLKAMKANVPINNSK